jgi:hypothetical protein
MPPELVIIIHSKVVVCFVVVAGMIQVDSRHQPDLSPFPFWGGESDSFSMNRSPLNCVALAIKCELQHCISCSSYQIVTKFDNVTE